MTKKRCDKCGKEDKRKNLKRIKGGWLCEKCHKEKLEKKRENIKRNVLGITEEQELEEKKIIQKNDKKKYNGNYKEYQRDYAKKKYWKNKKLEVPKIKGEKPVKEKTIDLMKGLYLRRDEKLFLYKKLIANGLTKLQARERINQNIKNLEQLKTKMIKQNKPEEEISKIFKEEFAKLIDRE